MKSIFNFDKYFDEGVKYLKNNDIPQAGEKFYKCAEESIKFLSKKYNLPEYKEAKSNGRWNSNLLFSAAESLTKILNKPINYFWSRAWIIHVEGFHERRLRKEIIENWLPDIKKIIEISKGG